ncbi:MAG TPA: nuclear transport factor 2 family protein [Gemmatimonadales bacterium]|nr:nuclear transport factor 2 family protein [Gemmatimonadales bacterium]
MKTLSIPLLLALAIPACRPGTVAESAIDRAAVDAALEQYRQAWLQGDTAMALGLISSDVQFLFPGEPDMQSDAVHALFIREMAAYRVSTLTLKRSDFFVAGDHAVDIGTYEEIQVPKTGAPIHGSGRYMTVWRREPGGWRIWRFMINELPK